jgi:glycosyltransferase involved in cell wall biosynthesis
LLNNLKKPSFCRKILIVTYVFPPTAGAGVQRPVKFVKYLKLLGWTPVVLTAKNASVPVKDFNIIKDIPDGTKVIRARTFEPSYNLKQKIQERKKGKRGWRSYFSKFLSKLLIPDAQVLWWPGLIPKLISTIKGDRPDCIFVTAPPYSSMIPVTIIGKLFGLPVIADYRDEWVFDRNVMENKGKGKFEKFCDRLLEGMVIKNCTGITATTQSYLLDIFNRYPQYERPNYAITNGYDPDDFKDAKKQACNGKIRMVYAGTVYKANSLKPFVEALKLAIERKPELEKYLEVKVIGRIIETEKVHFDDERVSQIVRICDYVPHDRIIQEIVSADILLLTYSDLPGAERVIPGKVFEYMATGNHIIAIVPDGEAKNILINNYQNVTVFRPTELRKISEFLSCLDSNSIFKLEKLNGQVEQFSRRNLANKLSEFANRVIQNNIGQKC